jgi:MFS transporter, PAT family, beta-lactamase induction signal transducer AmpG
MQSRLDVWIDSLRLYLQPRVIVMLFLGFSAGIPLPLTGFVLRQWLSESDVTLTAIGLSALIGIAYSFKFVWAPFMDRLELPWFSRRLGRRRGWMLPVQVLLALAIAGMALTDPRVFPIATVAVAVAVAFLSASQDIVIDAYRIETVPAEEQGAALAAYVGGYRVAVLVANPGALFIVGFAGWPAAFISMGILIGVGIVTCLVMREPAAPAPQQSVRSGVEGAIDWIKSAVIGPFREFMQRDAWLALLAFVALFKLGEALAGIMVAPFYRSLGFTRDEVALVSGLFGFFTTLGGVVVGGMLVYRFGVFRALIATGILQMVSNLMYVALAQAGHNVGMLWLQVGVEGFTDGLADAAFIAYLSSLCNIAFTATQYALMSSLAAVPLRTLGASSGWLAEMLGWQPFFLLTTAAALPALIIAVWLSRRFPVPEAPPRAVVAAQG